MLRPVRCVLRVTVPAAPLPTPVVRFKAKRGRNTVVEAAKLRTKVAERVESTRGRMNEAVVARLSAPALVIGQDGASLGTFPAEQALAMARKDGLDMLLVNVRPPCVRVWMHLLTRPGEQHATRRALCARRRAAREPGSRP